MARMIVEGPDLVVGLSWLEKLGAFRGDVRVPAARRALRRTRAVPVGRSPPLSPSSAQLQHALRAFVQRHL